MRKKLLALTIIWVTIGATVVALYLFREKPFVKEIIAWAISIWPILAAIGGLGVLASGWIIKHDFGRKVKGIIRENVVTQLTLTDTLTAMHRRLVELQKEKVSHTKIGFRQMEKVMPTLANTMGTVKLKEWPKFEKRIKRRLQQLAGLPNLKEPKTYLDILKSREQRRERVERAALRVGEELKDELFHTKGWKLEDVVKASKWVDDYGWGIKQLRDDDPQWNMLHESIIHHRKDEMLNKLIEQYIDLSYGYSNVSLLISYSKRHVNNVFSSMLHQTLVGSPISPEKAEFALSEILSSIEKRLAEITGPTVSFTKAKITAEIPASSLIPAISIERTQYETGDTPLLRVEYIASSTEVLSSMQREAKLRIQQGSYQEDILPVSILPGTFGKVASSADYRVPMGLHGETIITPLVTLPDGSVATGKPYTVYL